MDNSQIIELPDVKIYAKTTDYIADHIRRDFDISVVSQVILENVIKHFGEIFYIEVGCNYGLELIRSSIEIKKKTNKYKILAFDPGEASSYVNRNLELNGLINDVIFSPIAISDSNGVAELFGENDHSENNRLVNDRPGSKVIGMVETDTLDNVIEEANNTFPIVMKIDTQGAEYEVFKGGIETLKNRPSFIIAEFTPWALSSRIAPEIFLKELSEVFEIYDLGAKRDKCIQVSDLDSFTRDVDAAPPLWTDILLLSKSHEEFNKEIINSIRQSF